MPVLEPDVDNKIASAFCWWTNGHPPSSKRKMNDGMASENSDTVSLAADASDLKELVPMVELENNPTIQDATPVEVIFYTDPNFSGQTWGLTPYPDQPSAPEAPGQHCYFVDG